MSHAAPLVQGEEFIQRAGGQQQLPRGGIGTLPGCAAHRLFVRVPAEQEIQQRPGFGGKAVRVVQQLEMPPVGDGVALPHIGAEAADVPQHVLPPAGEGKGQGELPAAALQRRQQVHLIRLILRSSELLHGVFGDIGVHHPPRRGIGVVFRRMRHARRNAQPGGHIGVVFVHQRRHDMAAGALLLVKGGAAAVDIVGVAAVAEADGDEAGAFGVPLIHPRGQQLGVKIPLPAAHLLHLSGVVGLDAAQIGPVVCRQFAYFFQGKQRHDGTPFRSSVVYQYTAKSVRRKGKTGKFLCSRA